MHACLVAQSCLTLFVTPWTVARQSMEYSVQRIPLSMEYSRQEYWSGYPFPSAGDLPDPGIEPRSPALQADSSLPEPPGKPTVVGLFYSLWLGLSLESWSRPGDGAGLLSMGVPVGSLGPSL